MIKVGEEILTVLKLIAVGASIGMFAGGTFVSMMVKVPLQVVCKDDTN